MDRVEDDFATVKVGPPLNEWVILPLLLFFVFLRCFVAAIASNFDAVARAAAALRTYSAVEGNDDFTTVDSCGSLGVCPCRGGLRTFALPLSGVVDLGERLLGALLVHWRLHPYFIDRFV